MTDRERFIQKIIDSISLLSIDDLQDITKAIDKQMRQEPPLPEGDSMGDREPKKPIKPILVGKQTTTYAS